MAGKKFVATVSMKKRWFWDENWLFNTEISVLSMWVIHPHLRESIFLRKWVNISSRYLANTPRACWTDLCLTKEWNYHTAELLKSKKGSNYKTTNCPLEGVFLGAVSWSNTGLLLFTSLFVLHFIFPTNCCGFCEIWILLFPCHPQGVIKITPLEWCSLTIFSLVLFLMDQRTMLLSNM